MASSRQHHGALIEDLVGSINALNLDVEAEKVWNRPFPILWSEPIDSQKDLREYLHDFCGSSRTVSDLRRQLNIAFHCFGSDKPYLTRPGKGASSPKENLNVVEDWDDPLQVSAAFPEPPRNISELLFFQTFQEMDHPGKNRGGSSGSSHTASSSDLRAGAAPIDPRRANLPGFELAKDDEDVVDAKGPVSSRTRARKQGSRSRNLLATTLSSVPEENHATATSSPPAIASGHITPIATSQSTSSTPLFSTSSQAITSSNRRTPSPLLPSPKDKSSTRVENMHSSLRNAGISRVAFNTSLTLLDEIHEPLLSEINWDDQLDDRFLEAFVCAVRHGHAQIHLGSMKNYEEDQSAPVNEQVFHLLNLLSGSNDRAESYTRRSFSGPESHDGNEQGNDGSFRSFLSQKLLEGLKKTQPQLCKSQMGTGVDSDRGCYYLFAMPSAAFAAVANGEPAAAFVVEIKRIEVAEEAMQSIAAASMTTLIMNVGDSELKFPEGHFFEGEGKKNGKTLLPQVRLCFYPTPATFAPPDLFVQILGEFSANKTDTVVLFTWDKLMVFRLVKKDRVEVSTIVQRDDGLWNWEYLSHGHFGRFRLRFSVPKNGKLIDTLAQAVKMAIRDGSRKDREILSTSHHATQCCPRCSR